MSKSIPEINVTSYDSNSLNNDPLSDVPSEGATDCEFIDSFLQKKKDHVYTTDLEWSSDDENTAQDYPKDVINSILDIGMNSEEVLNSEMPNKSQRSVTCSLERFKPHVKYDFKYSNDGTDTEGHLMSEDDVENAQLLNESNEYFCSDDNAYNISVSERTISPTKHSPVVTPEPKNYQTVKKDKNKLKVNGFEIDYKTDTEILSDIEKNTNRFKKFGHNKFPNRSSTDSDDSDSFYNQARNKWSYKKLKDLDPSRKSVKSPTNVKTKQVLAIRPQSQQEAPTDTEFLESDCSNFSSRNDNPRRIAPQRNKNSGNCKNPSSKPKLRGQGVQNMDTHKRTCNFGNKFKKDVLNVQPDSHGYATDIEAFESDEDNLEEEHESKAVDFLPVSKCELVLSNENNKCGVSMIMPIKESDRKTLTVEEYDCGYSDVEDLPGFELEDYVRYPTPELPRTESSVIKNQENLIDKSKLLVKIEAKDPFTDTEELDLSNPKPMLNIKLDDQNLSTKISDCATDIEDLNENDIECLNTAHQTMTNLPPTTDIDDFSGEGTEDDCCWGKPRSPEILNSNTYVMTKEGLNAFSKIVKQSVNEKIPRVVGISPSPIPHATDTEDVICSQDDNVESYNSSENEKLEDHNSVIHIKHTRKFEMEGEESAYIKGNAYPEPLTDVEEILIAEMKGNSKSRAHCKRSNFDGSSIKICFTGPKSCSSYKWKPRCMKNHGRGGERHTTETTKEAIDPKKVLREGIEEKTISKEILTKDAEDKETKHDSADSKHLTENLLASDKPTPKDETVKEEVEEKFKKDANFTDTSDQDLLIDEGVSEDVEISFSVEEDVTSERYEYSDDDSSPAKPYITTPTQTRRNTGLGGSQRLPQGERPTVRVVTDFLVDAYESDEEENYMVTEPYERPHEAKRNIKIRFSPDLYDDDEKKPSIEEVKEEDKSEASRNVEKVEKCFERMASKTKEADPKESVHTEGEFEKMVSQLSLEEVDQALHQWEAGGLTPSDIDSKEITVSSEEISPSQQGFCDIFKPNLSSILPTTLFMGPPITLRNCTPDPNANSNNQTNFAQAKCSIRQIIQSSDENNSLEGETVKCDQQPKETEIPHREGEEETQGFPSGSSVGATRAGKQGDKAEKK